MESFISCKIKCRLCVRKNTNTAYRKGIPSFDPKKHLQRFSFFSFLSPNKKYIFFYILWFFLAINKPSHSSYFLYVYLSMNSVLSFNRICDIKKYKAWEVVHLLLCYASSPIHTILPTFDVSTNFCVIFLHFRSFTHTSFNYNGF